MPEPCPRDCGHPNQERHTCIAQPGDPEPKAATLKPCPCGETPTSLHIDDGTKWAYVTPNCCGDWSIEFRTDYHALDSPERMALAVEAWNEAERGGMRP